MEKEIPDSWVEIELGNILKLKNGYAFKSADFKDTGVPVIRISNIQNELVQTENAARVDQSKIKQEFIVQKGDILIAMSGATTGKYGIYNENIVAAQNQRVGNLVPHDENLTSRRFIYYLLGGLKKEIEDKAYGGAQPNISPKIIEEIIIGLPPLPEQQRIVAKLDTLFGHLDTLKTRLDRIPQLLKDFRQKVLTLAVTGKLTEEWREGRDLNPIEFETIKKILLKSNPSRANQEKIESIFDESEIGLFSIPDEWIFANLNKVCSSFSYGTSEKSDNDGLIPVLRMGNLQNGKLDWTDLKYSSNKDEIEKYNLKAGDVLFNRTNSPELVGKTSIYRGELPAIYAGYLIKIEVIENFLDPEYLNISLNTEFAKNWCWAVKSDGVSQSNINAQKLARFVISLPSLEEQQEIVRRVESLFAKADQIEASYQKLKAKIEQLPQALLAKAFCGELVEQLPTDGDARELLEEIHKAKAGLEKGGKTKKMKENEEVRMVAEDGVRYGKK